MADEPGIAANASANYLFHRLSEAIGTIATQTGTIAALQHQLAEAQKPKVTAKTKSKTGK